jgi:hypothetical protein
MPAKPVMPSRPAAPARPAPTGRKASIIGLLGLLVGLVGGYGAGRVSTGTPVNPLAEVKIGSYQDGYNAAKKKIEDSHVFPPAPTEAASLTGTIKSIGTDSIVLEVVITSPNPLDELNYPKERTVTLTSATKFEREAPKTPEEFQKDMDAFQKAAAAGGAPVTPPSSLKLEPIALQDLKVGDTVTVMADHNILPEASFQATEIDLSPTAVSPVALPPNAPGSAPATQPSP